MDEMKTFIVTVVEYSESLPQQNTRDTSNHLRKYCAR